MHAKRIRGQMSESMLTAVFIILSGGLQDSYTYLCRGKVFANAQTGNIVLLSAYLFDGEWSHCTRYLVPVLAFMLGIFVAECVHRHYKYMERVHWRQLIILSEIVLLFAVGFLPQTINTFANAVVSFVCAMQVQTFRKVRGHAYASTMCIGNMRSGTEALCVYFSQDLLLPQIIGLGRTTVFSTPMFYAHSAASAICYSFFLFQ